MSLVDIEVSISASDLPGDVLGLLREADSRVDEYVNDIALSVNGFVPSDFATVYRILRAIVESKLAPGNSFCEWGSGFGVVAALAAMLEFDACGIETEKVLVDASRRLVEDFDLPVEFVHGSFIPPEDEAFVAETWAADNDGFSWVVTEADGAYADLGLDPDDFDVVFVYPWPSDEPLMAALFERRAAEGALLITQDQNGAMRIRRKVSR